MKITMISNYINHHQIPFSNALYKLVGSDYHFIQTEPMEAERKAMGWSVEEDSVPYLVELEKEPELCKDLLDTSDILLVGWMEREDLITPRLQQGKFTIRISERLYREGQWKAISPRGLVRKYQDHTRYRKSPVYLLCAGAYVASDFHLVGAYPGKMYRFGYFPQTSPCSLEEQLAKKPDISAPDAKIQLVWAGRFIPLKHPEYMLQLAAFLQKKGYPFHLHMVGGGELEESLKAQAKALQVEENITFYGFQAPEKVRQIMEQCHIHIFTSNHLEGWGAVVNEAMNSACVEIANVAVGAAPYLITHGKNGLLYDKTYESMEEQVLSVFDHKERIETLGTAAYETIATEWNAEIAAGRLLQFYEGFLQGTLPAWESGPFSKAPCIRPK